MNKIVTWFLLMQKRYLKKPGFIIILLLIIPISFFYKFSSSQNSGFFTVAIPKNNDAIAEKIISDLQKNTPSLKFIICENQLEAENLLSEKKANAAWIFDSHMEEKIQKMGTDGIIRPVVKIIQGEDSVLLAFSREILYSKIYPYFSYSAYSSYVKQRISNVKDSELRFQYERFSSVPDLFTIQSAGQSDSSFSFMLSPLRGMLSLWIFLSAFAACLYFMQDKLSGTFTWLKNRRRFSFYFFMNIIPVFDASVIMIFALYFAGIFQNIFIEISSLILLSASSVLFISLLRMITKSRQIFAGIIPLLILVMLVLCPIFLKVNSFRALQFLFPIFYYLNSIYSAYYLFLFLVYTFILFLLNLIAERLYLL